MTKGVSIGKMTGAALCSDRTTYVYWNLYEQKPRWATVRLRQRWRRMATQDEETAITNVTGQRQTKCHVFPDVEPDDPETPVLEDVEPVSDDSPIDTVDCADSPRQESVPRLVWGCLNSTAIVEMISELQPHDRDDLRQDMAMKYWRKAVRQELRGQRISNLTKWLTADVVQWIGERTDIAVGEPLTKQQIDDAKGDTLLLQRSASEESRLEKLEHDLRIEQSRFAAEVEAKRRQSKPRAILTLKW